MSLLVTLLLGLAAVPGQVDTDVVTMKVDPEETRRLRLEFAECVVKKHRAEARRYVLGQFIGDKERDAIVGRLADPDCFDTRQMVGTSRMAIPPYAMSYMLSDALVRAEYAAAPIADFEDVLPLRHALILPEASPKGTKPLKPSEQAAEAEKQRVAQAVYFTSLVGECVARMDPAKALALTLTTPGTPGETAVFQSLMPAFGQCVPEGRTLALDREAMRGSIAENYYRLATAPKAPRPTQASEAHQ
jgi:hypothetical protein